jgi:hypothetical protein
MKPGIRPFHLLSKAIMLFVITNVLFALTNPPVYDVSLYNTVFPGRVRFPFGVGKGIYSVMVDNLDIMTASHEISAPKAADEIRVVVIGDSSVWGEGAPVSESISVLWNEYGFSCGTQKLKFYNLAYPHPSAAKDLIILDKSMEYDPDLIVWFMTLNTLTSRSVSPFIKANPERAARVLDAYDLPYDLTDVKPSNELESFYEKTLVGKSSDLARLVRLQALGLIWTLTGADTTPPSQQRPDRPSDVTKQIIFKGRTSADKLERDILWNALSAGHEIAGDVPVLLVNEPIFIATGANSHVRYNNGYPRWAYDYYRDELLSKSQANHWHYLDLWDSVPAAYFPDGVIHISAEGRHIVIEKTEPVVQRIACR